MDGIYDIMLDGQTMGKAEVKTQGLYYAISCRCRLSGNSVYKLTVICGDDTENLGILVPEGGSFVLRTRLPKKKLPKGKPQFHAALKHPELSGKFVPLCPEEPFAYLARLKHAFLEVRDGQTGIRLPQDQRHKESHCRE